jgi:hypothetical protein
MTLENNNKDTESIKIPDTPFEGFNTQPPTVAEKAAIDQKKAEMHSRTQTTAGWEPRKSPERTAQQPGKKRGRALAISAIAGGVGVLLVGAGVALSSVGSGHTQAPEDKPSTSGEKPSTLTQTEKTQANIDARPEIGSDEYKALFKNVAIPYVEGQPHEEVVAENMNAIDAFYDLGYSDAPHTREEKLQWSIENGTASKEDTYAGIIQQLDLGYFNEGLGETYFGPDWKSNSFAVDLIDYLQKKHELAMMYYLTGQDNVESTIKLDDAGITQEKDTSRAESPSNRSNLSTIISKFLSHDGS